MILVCGGIKGGVGKTTIATNMAVMHSAMGNDVLLVDADDQETSIDFTMVRNETLADRGGAGYTAVKLRGAAVRADTLKLAQKYEDVVIDVGGRDTAAQRAALSVADIFAVPFLPASFDIWALEKVAALVEEARAYNEKLKALCFLNRADPRGSDNQEAASYAQELSQFVFIDAPLGNRKAFRNAAAQGLAVTEVRPKDTKAIEEVEILYRHLFDIN